MDVFCNNLKIKELILLEPNAHTVYINLMHAPYLTVVPQLKPPCKA